MEQSTVQYFNITRTPTKRADKVWNIERIYDDMLPKHIYKTCSRCSCNKHLSQYGINTRTGEPLQWCQTCTERVKEWKATHKKPKKNKKKLTDP